METTGKRLKKALKALGMSQIDLSSKIEEDLQLIRNISSDRKKLTPELALIIEDKTGISASYLVLGKGDMFDKQAGALAKSFDSENGSRLQVPFYSDIKASAGNGYVNSEEGEVDVISLPKVLVDKRIQVGKMDAIKVHGDSMTPTIDDGDVVFICKKEQDLIDGKIYVVKYNNEIYIKRIFKRKETIIIKSDNPIYPQDEIAVSEVDIIGKLVYNMKALF